MKSQGASTLVSLLAFALLVAFGVAGYKLIRAGCPRAKPALAPQDAPHA
jgi:hypothetical protein